MKSLTKSAGIVAAIVCCLGILACENGGDTPVSFTPDLPDASSLSTGNPAPPPTTTSNPGTQPPAPTPGRCEIINIRRRDVTETTDGLKVTMFVPVSYDPAGPNDRLLVYVWLPRVNNGEQKGPFPANEEFSFTVDDYTTYQYQLAVEVDIDGDGKADAGLQCDNHTGEFTTRRDPEPPCEGEQCNPPPECPEPNVDIDGVCLPVCEQDVNELRTLLNGVTEEPTCHPFCEVNPNHPTCQPPPPCDEEKLEAEARREANAQCEHGVESIQLNLNACTYRFTCKPPPPPTCEELNPETIFGGSGNSAVANIANGRKRVTVNASGGQGGAAFSGDIGILWRRNGSKYVKAFTPTANRCGQRSGTKQLSWTSTGGSHTACNANYSLIWYTNGSRSNPNIQHEISLPKTGICAAP